MKTAFWVSAAFVVYTYVGYPLVVWVVSRFAGTDATSEPPAPLRWPTVSVVVSVYNEERRVEAKIANLRALDYPSGRLRIVFVSDGSTDSTCERIAASSDVTLLRYPDRAGKPHALNLALRSIDSEVVVFTDVRQELDPMAVRWLVSRLMQPGIGAVSGELVHRDPTTHAASHIGLYWRYEKWIRKSESAIASNVGVTGALYAIRRVDYEPLPPDTLLDDFVVPMHIVRRGGRVVFEPRAVIYDELQPDTPGERKRKVRTLSGNFQACARDPWMFLPWRNPVVVQFVSHKVFRLLVPYALGVMLVASLLVAAPLYRAAAAAQVALYAVAAAGMAAATWRRNRFVSFAVVFVELNWAAVLALFTFVSGRLDAKWERT